MDVVFDFAAGGPAAERERAERLLACYQQALGHELPNLLVSIQGLARLLDAEHGARLDEGGRELLRRIAEVAHRADCLTRSVAGVGRACRNACTPGAVSLSEACREAVAEVNLLSPATCIEYDIAEEMPIVTVSHQALHQVLVQLLRNAARAGVPGERLRVALSARRTPVGLELLVADDGRGIPGDAARRLTEPFSGNGGRGLGLFLVRQLVHGWGGALRVMSEPGAGTVVALSFPDEAVSLPCPASDARVP